MTIIRPSVRRAARRFIHLSLVHMADGTLISVKIFSDIPHASQRCTRRREAVAVVMHTRRCSGPAPAVLTGYQSRRKKQCESRLFDFSFVSVSIMLESKAARV